MNRQKFMKIIAGGALAAMVVPSIADVNQEKHQSEKVEYIKGFEHGYVSCLNEIRRQTKFSPKKCLEYDGMMYIAGIRGRML